MVNLFPFSSLRILGTISRSCSNVAENANIIDHKGPDLTRRLWDTFLKMKKTDENTFRSVNLLKGRRSEKFIYGGQVVAHSLKAACETVTEELSPHSFHSYFIKAGSVYEPVDYKVESLRDGRSFCTRRVNATQAGELLFTANVSFQREEESTMHHKPKIDLPVGPEGLDTARTLMKNRLAQDPEDMEIPAKLFLTYKLAEFPPTFHKIFEARPVNSDVYKMDIQGELHKPEFTMWIRPTIPIGSDAHLHRLLAAYVSDSSMVETALLPHLAKGFVPGMTFSLDHCFWFHHNHFNMDDWMLWEQVSDISANTRTYTRGRLFTKDGSLVMTAAQEGLARPGRF